MKKTMVLGGLPLLAGFACSGEEHIFVKGEDAALATPAELGQLRAAIRAPEIEVDADKVRFRIVAPDSACSAAAIEQQTADIEEEGLPVSGDVRAFAERFFTLSAGRYKLCAQPLDSDGRPSADCRGDEAEVEVEEGNTAAAVLTMMCDRSGGGLSVVGAFNSAPEITSVQASPSRSISQCESMELRALIQDAEGQDVEVSWRLLSEGGTLSSTLGTSTTFEGEPGDHEVEITAVDSLGARSVLTVPLFVTDSVCSGAFPIEFAPEAGASDGQPLSLGDDQVSPPIPLGFEFSFFNEVVDTAFISSNGFLHFQSSFDSGCCNGGEIPLRDNVNGMVAFAWTDWNPSAGGEIFTRTLGEAPNRRFILDFIMVPEFGNNEGHVITQVQLLEGSNEVEIHTEQLLVVDHVVTQGVESDNGTTAFFLPGRVAEQFSLTGDAVRFQTNFEPGRCGNGEVEIGEACDDGNDIPGDGCFECETELSCQDAFECQCFDIEACSCLEGACTDDGACDTAADCFPGLSCLSGFCSFEQEGCTEDSDCGFGVCDEGRCVECVQDDDCSFGICGPEQFCVECRTDIDCSDAEQPFCSERGNFCSECRLDEHCAPGDFCDIDFCRLDTRCDTNADCSSPGAPLCDPDIRECVGCVSSEDCGEEEPFCSEFTNSCGECDASSGSGCPDDSLGCGPDGRCIECFSDFDCGPVEACVFGPNSFGGTCVSTAQCAIDEDCDEGFVCEELLCLPELACSVAVGQELFVTDLSVLEDPVRSAGGGVWSFGGLMRQMAPSEEEAPAFVEAMFSTWLVDQTVNGFTMPARLAIGPQLLDAWPRSADGLLDLDRAPLRLNAIVNRIDIRNLDTDDGAGEGRFVFAVDFPDSEFPQQFTVILEYMLPASTEQEVLDWANRWHALGSLPFPSEEYNAALQAVTDGFAQRGALPEGVNGSALNQVRTNEIALTSPWELREFVLSSDTLLLEPAVVELTPDLQFNNTETLASFINQNEDSIVVERHEVPLQFEGQSFQAASSFNDLQTWNAPGIDNPEARHKFALNTCSGCHGPEVGIFDFLQVHPRSVGQRPRLAGFLTGIVVNDPVTGEARNFNDLERRRQDLAFLACGEPPNPIDPVLPVPPGAGGGSPGGPIPIGPGPIPIPFPGPGIPVEGPIGVPAPPIVGTPGEVDPAEGGAGGASAVGAVDAGAPMDAPDAPASGGTGGESSSGNLAGSGAAPPATGPLEVEAAPAPRASFAGQPGGLFPVQSIRRGIGRVH